MVFDLAVLFCASLFYKQEEICFTELQAGTQAMTTMQLELNA